MANQKTVAVIDAILTYYRKGWSQRRIARELAIDRETVARHVAVALAADSKPAISIAGESPATGNPATLASDVGGPPESANPAISTPGDSAGTGPIVAMASGAVTPPDPAKPAISTAGTAGRQSLCQPLREWIAAKLETGLTAQRI